MGRVSRFLLLLTAFVTLSCTLHPITASEQKHDFAFVIPCQWAGEEGFCLLGANKNGLKATLLEKGQSKLCITKTGKSREYEWVSHSISITKLHTPHSCGTPDLYSVAILNSQIWDYEILSLEEIVDEEKIGSFDAFVRSTTALESLRTKAQGSVPGEVSEIENPLPRLYRYRTPEMNAFIVAYDELEHGHCCSGPRVIAINGTVYPLTGSEKLFPEDFISANFTSEYSLRS